MTTDNLAIIEITKGMEKIFFRHIKHIALQLRPADIDELSAASELSPYSQVIKDYKQSTRKWMIIRSEGGYHVPIAVFGVSALDCEDSVGAPWMVATSDIRRIGDFLRDNTKKYVTIMKEGFKHLLNYVDVRNKVSIKWLKGAGFEFGDEFPLGKEGLPFQQFFIRGVE